MRSIQQSARSSPAPACAAGVACRYIFTFLCLVQALIAFGGCASNSRPFGFSNASSAPDRNISPSQIAAANQSNVVPFDGVPNTASGAETRRPQIKESPTNQLVRLPPPPTEVSPIQPAAFQSPDDPPKPAAKPGVDSTVPEELPPAPGAMIQVLTLDQAVQLCLINDPQLRAGLEAISQANADALTASLKPNPILFTDIQLLPLTRPFTPTRQGGPPQQDVQLGLPIDWLLFGKRAAAMASAAQGVQISQADYEDLIRQRVAQAKLAFFDVAETDSLVGLARQDVANLTDLETSIQKSVAAGGRPQVELERIRLNLLVSRRTLRDVEAQSYMARARLNAIVGGVLTNRAYTTEGAFDQPLRAQIPSTETAYELALENRPDLNSLRWRVSQARAQMLVEQRKAKPEMTLTFGYTHQYQLRTIGFPDAESWSGALGMPLPIYNRNQGNRMKAQSVAVQNQFQLEAGELALWSEIESVLAELTAARNNAMAVADIEMKLAEKVLDSMRTSYGLGGRTLLELLDAQRSYRDTRRAYANTRANYWRAHTKFQAAVAREDGP